MKSIINSRCGEHIKGELIMTATARRFSSLPFRLAAIASITLASAAAAAAENADDPRTVVSTQPVVVTATRTAQPLNQAASSISVVTEKDVEERQPVTFTELLLDIPNVDVDSFNSVMYNRISIRGSGDRQITFLIDGMRQDNQTLGGNRPSGIFVDTELLKQVEVKHGGGSSLYGNGGIGGTIAVETKDASDFLQDSEKDFGATLKAGYVSDNLEWQKSAYVYGRSELWDVVAGVTRRDSGASTNSETGHRSTWNVDNDSTSAFAKATLSPVPEHLLQVAYFYDIAHNDRDNGRTRFDKYRYEQHRVSGKWEFEKNDWVNLKTALQYAESKFRYEGDAAGISKDKYDSVSGNIQNTSYLTAFGRHEITFGGDFSKTSQNGQMSSMNGWVADGSRPDSDGFDGGLFIEDQYAMNEYLSVVPVLRWSYFKRESNESFPSLSDSKFMPGVTLRVTPVESLLFWGSVNTGYRPPILDEMYFRMTYPDLPLTSIVVPNPDLKPEKSVNYEMGASALFANLAAEGDELSVKAAIFYDDIKDYISADMIEFDQDAGTMTFQTLNYGHVVNKGVELSGSYAVGNFRASASYGYLHSEDKETGERIEANTPQSANLRLSYRINAFGLEPWYRLHWAKGGEVEDQWGDKTAVDDYATHDIGVTWTPARYGFVELQAGLAVTNVTNEKYIAFSGSSYPTSGFARGVRAWLSARF